MPNKQLTVSVVMCTHNGMEFIQEQLESILSQTYPIYQLIISDDNSTDGTLEFAAAYVREFVAKHKKLANLRFQTIENIPALGVTKNFEKAISKAKGDLVALSDQDDYWEPNKIEVMVRYFQEKNDLLLLHSDAKLVDSERKDLGISLFEALSITKWEFKLAMGGQELPILMRRNIVTGAATVFRRKLFNISEPFPNEFLHDEWLALVAAFEGQSHLILDQLFEYRQHSHNVVGVKKLGVRHAVGRLLFPRTLRNQILIDRAKALVSHPYILHNSSVDAAAIANTKLQHEEARTAYPTKKIERILPIFHEAKTGRYNLVGLGAQDVLRDFIQPD